MIRPLQEVAVPEVGHNDAAVAEFLSQMTEESLPVFAVPDAGQDMRTVVEWLRPALSAHRYAIEMDEKPLGGTNIPATTRPILGEVGEHPGDKVVHIDGKPGERLSYNLHLTTVGRGKAYFYEPAPAFYGKFGRLPFGVRNSLDRGLVDTNVFLPVRHTAHMSIGTLIVFRASGQAPLAHDFRTLVAPRRAEITRIAPHGLVSV